MKYIAAYFNGVAIAVFAIGILPTIFNPDPTKAVLNELWIPAAISAIMHLFVQLVLMAFKGDD